jgi:hypothetical protein
VKKGRWPRAQRRSGRRRDRGKAKNRKGRKKRPEARKNSKTKSLRLLLKTPAILRMPARATRQTRGVKNQISLPPPRTEVRLILRPLSSIPHPPLSALALLLNLPPGTQLKMVNAVLENIGVMECYLLNMVVKCERCKEQMEVGLQANQNFGKLCAKCQQPFALTFRPGASLGAEEEEGGEGTAHWEGAKEERGGRRGEERRGATAIF